MKEKLKPMSQAFVKNAIGLDGIINALTRTAPTPPVPPEPTVWAKVHFAAPPAGWPGLGDHDGEDIVTLASINEVIASEYYSATSYKIENGVVSVYLSPFNEVVSPGEDGDWWEVFTIDSNKNVTASGTGTTKAYLVDDDQNQDTFPEYEKYAIVEDDYDHNKALLGFDANFNPTILKQEKPDPNREFATSIPDELKSYWDEYGSELDTSWVNIYSVQTDSYTGNVCVYGLHIYEEESDIGEGSVTDSWGDSNFPYLTVVFVSKSDAEVFYADSFPEGFTYYGLFSVGAHEILNSNDGTGTGEDCTTDKVLLGFNVYSPGDQWNSPILEPTILKKSHCYEIDFIKIPANKVLDYDNKIADYEGEDPPPPKLGSIWGWSYIKMHTSWAFYLRNNSEIEMQEAMDENGDSGFPTYPTFEQLTPTQAAAIYESMQ